VGSGFEPVLAADAIDAAWLTAMFHRAGVGVGRAVQAVTGQPIGTGQVGDNVRFELTWSAPTGGCHGAVPATVVGKFPSRSPISRATAVNVGTYRREVGFYRDLQPEVAIRTPGVLHVGWDAATHDFVILMDDVSPSRPGDQLAGCSLVEAEQAIDQAVGLHAPTWGRTVELRRLDWLDQPEPERVERMGEFLRATYPGFASRYAQRLLPADRELGAALVERYPTLAAHVATWAERHSAWCVTHGDYRLDNLLFGPDGGAPAVTVVDWQTVTVGIGPGDIAYFAGAGLLPEDRAEHERALVARYGRGLRRAGVDVDGAALWDGYVLGSASGYLMAVLASQIVERTERGDEMFAVMAERHAAQMRDVGLLDCLQGDP
jgi:hypothetical protein